MRNIRTYADIEAARKAGELTSAEEKLIACSVSGTVCRFAYGPHTTPAIIGADLLRYLITGGDTGCQVHDLGIQLIGAVITNTLDLDYAKAKGATTLQNCHFKRCLHASNCHLNKLNLQGSYLEQGLFAQAIEVKGDIFLRKGFLARKGVSLSGAKIGGQLDCQGGLFKGGDFDALDLESVQASAFFWREIQSFSGCLNLTGAHFGILWDDAKSWTSVPVLILVGLSYNNLPHIGEIPTRLKWLRQGGPPEGELSPHPYTQLAKVLREMGYDHGARQVLFEKERHLANAQKQRGLDRIRAIKDAQTTPEFRQQSQQAQQNGQVELAKLREEQFFATLWSETLRRLVGYGYKPRLIFYWTGGIILAMAVLSSLTYRLGGMVPNAPVVLLSDEWGRAVIEFNPAEAWLATDAGQHYETFCALAYAADVFIPLVPLGQEVAWAPTTATRLGTVLWVLNWLVKLAGWFITALGAAAIAGVIRRE